MRKYHRNAQKNVHTCWKSNQFFFAMEIISILAVEWISYDCQFLSYRSCQYSDRNRKKLWLKMIFFKLHTFLKTMRKNSLTYFFFTINFFIYSSSVILKMELIISIICIFKWIKTINIVNYIILKNKLNIGIWW